MSTASVTPNPYAEFQQPASGASPYAEFQQPVTDIPKPQDGFIKSAAKSSGLYDLAGAVNINNPHGAIVDAVNHPLDTAKNLWNSEKDTINKGIDNYKKEGLTQQTRRDFVDAVPIAGPMLHKARDQYDSGNRMGAAGTMAGGIGGLIAPSVIGKTGRLGSALRSGAESVDNAVIGAPAQALERGANPGAAISQNRLIASSPATLAPKLRSIIPDAVAEHRGVVSAAPAGKTIDAGNLISQPFSEEIGKATDPLIGASTPAQVRKAALTQRILTHVPDPNGGVTPMMRNPNLTPLEATDFKSNIYKMIDYDNPSRSALSNSGLKGAAHGLKSAVENAVPESIPSSQRLHNLMAAKDIVEPASRVAKLLPTSKAGVLDRAAMLAGTGTAAAMDATGAGLENIGRFLHPKPIYYAPPIMARRDQ